MLVALVDPLHVGHEISHEWLRRQLKNVKKLRWASCAMTCLGYLRVLSNPAYPGGATPLSDAADTLRKLRANHTDHEYWSCELDMLEFGPETLGRIQGHKQLTDAYLVSLCAEQRGVLVTLDTKIEGSSWAKEFRGSILTISRSV